MSEHIIGKSTAAPKGEDKPVPQLKQANVHIKSSQTLQMRTKVGGDIRLLVLGLGDDDIMYSYNAQTKQWFDRL